MMCLSLNSEDHPLIQSTIKFRRGDFDPIRGLYFWATIRKKDREWQYWVTRRRLIQLRKMMHDRVIEWQQRNPEKVRQNSRNQRAKQKLLGTRNRESEKTPRAKACAAKYKAAWWKNKFNSDPLFRLKVLVRKRIRNAIMAKGFRRCKRSFDIVGCTPQFLRMHLESKFLKGMSWSRRSQIHIDHIIPLSSAKSESELYALCHYTNLQPLWAIDNLKKNNKIPA